jgi:tRNA G18 (ribose-2'-O)-methylase SpoU
MKFRKLGMEEMGRLPAEESRVKEKFPLVFVLDNLRSLSNVGSVFRTADSLGLQGLFLCGFTGQPPHREIEKTALGATDSVFWRYFGSTTECLKELQAEGYHIAALEQTTESTLLQHFQPEGPLAIVLGNEISGVSDEALALVDEVVEIPQFGMKHSLNVAVSAGMLAWHVVNNRLRKADSYSTS